ncbi:MAG: HAD family hydrolase [Lachnospiraceae bacterium]
MIKAVIFDLDNTLYSYDKCNVVAEKKLFQLVARELSVSEVEAKSLLKQAKKNVKNQFSDDVAASHNRLLYMQNICEQVGKNPLVYAMEFYNCYWDAMLEEMQPFEYVLPLFQEYKKKDIKIAILTDLTAHIQYRKLQKLGLVDYIDCIVTSEEAGAEKPARCMFELVLSKLHLNADEVLMVGDSQAKDIDGAIRCGIQSILFKDEREFLESQKRYLL